MEIYLVRHGEAEAAERDPARPLTTAGREEATRVADRLAELDLDLGAIWHSGKLRAEQTAAIFALRLEPPEGAVQHPDLAPNDDPALAAEALAADAAAGIARPVMIVGHLPHLSRLASLIVTGDAARQIVSFRTAGVVCLGREDEGWRVRWMITPDET